MWSRFHGRTLNQDGRNVSHACGGKYISYIKQMPRIRLWLFVSFFFSHSLAGDCCMWISFPIFIVVGQLTCASDLASYIFHLADQPFNSHSEESLLLRPHHLPALRCNELRHSSCSDLLRNQLTTWHWALRTRDGAQPSKLIRLALIGMSYFMQFSPPPSHLS
jgi:hypothetical protein